jgi:ATP-dependent protease Clp ATPase subunit
VEPLRIVGLLLLIVFGFAILAAAMPILSALVGLAITAAIGVLVLVGVMRTFDPEVPWWGLAVEGVRGWRGHGYRASVLALGVLAGAAAVLLVGGLVFVASGAIRAGLVQFAVGALLLPVAPAILRKISGRDTMQDYLKLLGQGGVAAVRAELDASAMGFAIPEPQELIPRLQARVLGQDAAIMEVARTLSRRSRLRAAQAEARKRGEKVPLDTKPIGVFAFVGATGAGKTELAKALADSLDGQFFRVDCNEVTSEHEISQFIGSPPGYIGSDRMGSLTGFLETARRGVLLFDEIEKAHPRLFDVLMSLFDEGRLTDKSTSRTVSATNFVIVLTSNAEHERLAELAESKADPVEMIVQAKDVLRRFFKPEQLARIDAILVFRPLPFEASVALLLKMLQDFTRSAGMTIAAGGVEPEAVARALEAEAKIKKYGVREFKRLIESEITDQLLDLAGVGVREIRFVADGEKIRVEPA